MRRWKRVKSVSIVFLFIPSIRWFSKTCFWCLCVGSFFIYSSNMFSFIIKCYVLTHRNGIHRTALLCVRSIEQITTIVTSSISIILLRYADFKTFMSIWNNFVAPLKGYQCRIFNIHDNQIEFKNEMLDGEFHFPICNVLS